MRDEPMIASVVIASRTPCDRPGAEAEEAGLLLVGRQHEESPVEQQ